MARDGRLEPASGRRRRIKDGSDGPVEGCSEAHDPSQQACLDPSQAGPDSAVGHEEPGFDDHQEADRQEVTWQVSQSYVAGDLSEGNHQAGASDGAPACLFLLHHLDRKKQISSSAATLPDGSAGDTARGADALYATVAPTAVPGGAARDRAERGAVVRRSGACI
jgi:hypothetical protein